MMYPITKIKYELPEGDCLSVDKTVALSVCKEDGHDGLVYVEGFGYVKDSGPAQGKTVHSDGDINKMVGTMD